MSVFRIKESDLPKVMDLIIGDVHEPESLHIYFNEKYDGEPQAIHSVIIHGHEPADDLEASLKHEGIWHEVE